MTLQRSSARVSANILILVGALAAAAGLWFGARLLPAPSADAYAALVRYPAPRALPAFELVRSDGKPLALADLKGRWNVVFFGYTNCPDVCPMTLTTFKQAWKRLDDATRTRVAFDFVSVDPARDTPEQLARYVGFFDPAFVAATGSDEQLTLLTRALGLVYARGTPEKGTYAVDHSASAVVIDPDGNQIGLFRPPFDATQVAADLALLARSRR